MLACSPGVPSSVYVAIDKAVLMSNQTLDGSFRPWRTFFPPWTPFFDLLT